MQKDVLPEIMTFYLSVMELENNRPRALWKFATSATLFQVQRRNFSWRSIKAHKDRFRRLADLLSKSTSGALQEDEGKELAELLRRATPADVHAIYVTRFLRQPPPILPGPIAGDPTTPMLDYLNTQPMSERLRLPGEARPLPHGPIPVPPSMMPGYFILPPPPTIIITRGANRRTKRIMKAVARIGEMLKDRVSRLVRAFGRSESAYLSVSQGSGYPTVRLPTGFPPFCLEQV